MASRNLPVGIRAAFIAGGFLIAAALITGAIQLFSRSPEQTDGNTETTLRNDGPVASDNAKQDSRSATNQNSKIEGDNIVQQGDAPQTVVKDIKDSDVTLTVVTESNEAREARRQAERRRQNRIYMVSVSRWDRGTYAQPGGRKRSINRPVIEAIPSATKPTFKLNEDKSNFIVEVTQYVDDPKAEGGQRLERRTLESDPSFGEPTIEGPYE